ncbi:unnamed protein product [Nippostrongylus brasiliensis]|uniref:Uncharacterized protein n=1 Tax=Nippostrongylus brasiliensis TaxID=27835 RepID=A0A0N4YJY6_NIPBR|nr:unnamed protein product [Nippostrongylus brasiliensis]
MVDLSSLARLESVQRQNVWSTNTPIPATTLGRSFRLRRMVRPRGGSRPLANKHAGRRWKRRDLLNTTI